MNEMLKLVLSGVFVVAMLCTGCGGGGGGGGSDSGSGSGSLSASAGSLIEPSGDDIDSSGD